MSLAYQYFDFDIVTDWRKTIGSHIGYSAE